MKISLEDRVLNLLDKVSVETAVQDPFVRFSVQGVYKHFSTQDVYKKFLSKIVTLYKKYVI